MSKGGGMMGIGKSNAKMYVEKETGVTFRDVAGQDEAKESLQEVVDFLHNPKKYTEIRDASSASIIASALYELYWYTKDEAHKAGADKMIESLSGEPYRAEVGTNGGFILKHSVGSLPHSLLNIEAGRPNDHNIDVPLNYADYYFLEALIRKGRVEKGENPIK
jgi:hypothetical protein